MSNTKNRTFWMSITNLMAVLMIVFLFIAINYMGKDYTVQETRNYNNEIKAAFINLLENPTLMGSILQENGVAVDTNSLTLTFTNESILFSSGNISLTDEFKEQLEIIFPNLVAKVEADPILFDNLTEIRIEGHTDNTWRADSTTHESHTANMMLSQGRAVSVFDYVMNLPQLKGEEVVLPWYYHRTSALGMSFNNPVLTSGSVHTDQNLAFPQSADIDPTKSRRVTIALKLKEYNLEDM